jgi:hypothetical protein
VTVWVLDEALDAASEVVVAAVTATVGGDMAIGRVRSGCPVGNLGVAVHHFGGHRAMGDIGNSVVVDRRVDGEWAVQLGDSGGTGDRGTSWG